LSAFGIETGLKTRRNKAVARLKVMTPTKTLIYALALTLFVLAGANYSSGQGEKKPDKSKEEKELIARCKTKLIKKGPLPEPRNGNGGRAKSTEIIRWFPIRSRKMERSQM
jgi:hypothetical protein